MYRIINGTNCIATTALEIGDAPMGCVSGLLIDRGDINQFSIMLIELGAEEIDGEIRLELNDDIYLANESKEKIPYSGGCILCYKSLDEVLIDVVGIPYPEYQQLFPNHVKDYENLYKDT